MQRSTTACWHCARGHGYGHPNAQHLLFRPLPHLKFWPKRSYECQMLNIMQDTTSRSKTPRHGDPLLFATQICLFRTTQQLCLWDAKEKGETKQRPTLKYSTFGRVFTWRFTSSPFFEKKSTRCCIFSGRNANTVGVCHPAPSGVPCWNSLNPNRNFLHLELCACAAPPSLPGHHGSTEDIRNRHVECCNKKAEAALDRTNSPQPNSNERQFIFNWIS